MIRANVGYGQTKKSELRKISHMAEKPIWEKPNPKKKSTPLTASQKAKAKAMAKKANRPYPNLVDNLRAKKI